MLSDRNQRQRKAQSAKRTALSFALFALSCLLLWIEPAQAAPKHPRQPNTVLYQVKQGATSAQLAALNKVLKGHGFQTRRKMLSGKLRQAEATLPQGKTEEELADELKATGAVKFAELDAIESPTLIPNDQNYSLQWHLPKINAPTAWNITTGNTAVIAAVCDTGVEATHPDLQPNLILPGYNSADGTTNSSPAIFHGTYVAGALGAVGNNNGNVAGVSWNTKILPIRVTNNTTNGDSTCAYLVTGIEYAADHGAKVINVSYGTGGCPYAIDAAGQYARNKGGLLFISAGNDAADLSLAYTDFPSFVFVGATDQNDALASFSNYGTPIDLVAPGTNIETTSLGGNSGIASGTSLASPIAAGVAALVFSIRPSFTPAQVENFLFTTAADLGAPGDDNVFGHGRVDAGAAVTAAQNAIAGGNTAPTIASPATANPNPVTGPTTTLSVLGADDGGESNLTYTWAPTAAFANSISFSSNGTNASKNTVARFMQAGSYPLQVTITDSKGLVITSNVTVTVNQTVSAVSIYPAGFTVQAGTQKTFTATALDQFGNAMASPPSFTWSVSGGGSISTTGVFTAGGSAGGPFILTATGGGFTGYAYVTVSATISALTAPGNLIKAVSPWDRVAAGQLARTSDGKLHVVYQRVTNVGADAYPSIYYAYSSDAGKTWTEELAMASVNNVNSITGATFAVDGAGNIHVAWQSMDPNFIISTPYRQRFSGTWQTVEIVVPGTTAFQSPGAPHLVVDSSGNIIMITGTQYRKRAPGTSGTWGAPETMPSTCGSSALSFDTAENLHTFDGLHHCVRAAANNWQMEYIPHLSSVTVPSSASMAIDTGNNVYATWAQQGWDVFNPTMTYMNNGFPATVYLTNIMYSKRSAATSTWSTPELVTNAVCSLNGNETSLAVDGTGNVHLLWMSLGSVNTTAGTAYPENIWYRQRTTAGWQAPVTITDLPFEQGSPNLLWTFDPLVSGLRPNVPQTGFALVYRASDTITSTGYKLMYYASQNLTWPTAGGGNPPVINSALTATGVAGTSFIYSMSATNGPTTYNATGLPPGLTLNTTSGQISGTLISGGSFSVGYSSQPFNVSLSATNSAGTGPVAPLTLTVYSPCDVNQDGGTNVFDSRQETNMALGTTSCSNDITHETPPACNVFDVRRVTNAILGGSCAFGP